MSDWRRCTDKTEKRAMYMVSPEWGKLRAAVRKRSGGKCERCKLGPHQATHHLTYLRLYKERLSDLLGICSACHDFVHGRSGVDPKLAPRAAGPSRAFNDPRYCHDLPAPVVTPVAAVSLKERYPDMTFTGSPMIKPRVRPIHGVYLAGKITGDNWRDEIMKNWSDENKGSGASHDGWSSVANSVYSPDGRELNYTGPYWRPWGDCGGHCQVERCGGGRHADGKAGKHRGECVTDLEDLNSRIQGAIKNSHIVFAWISSLDCYGTLVEIGYASGKGKTIVVAMPNGFDDRELWLAGIQADVVIKAASAGDAWKIYWANNHKPWDKYHWDTDCPPLCGFPEEQERMWEDHLEDLRMEEEERNAHHDDFFHDSLDEQDDPYDPYDYEPVSTDIVSLTRKLRTQFLVDA